MGRALARVLFLGLSALLIPACGSGGGSGGGGAGAAKRGFTLARGFDLRIWALAWAADGSGDLYVGGDFTVYSRTPVNRLIRLNADGSVDTGFSVGTGFNNTVYAVLPALDGSGDIYVGGFFATYDGTATNNIIRLNADGSVDSGFSIGTGFNSTVRSIVAAADGSGDIYVGGYFSDYNGTGSNRIIRLNSDGSVDAAFATGTGLSNGSEVVAAAGDGSGDIYVGGNFTTYDGVSANRIVRLNSDGSRDAAFAIGAGFVGPNIYAIVPANDGSGDIYVGGDFFDYDGTGVRNLVRLNSDGSIDAGFATGTGFDWDVRSVGLAGDGSGDVYAGGNLLNYNGTPSARIIRLNSDGSVDAGFAIGTGFDSLVEALVVAEDGTGDLFAAGFLIRYNGTGANRIIRLKADGSVDTGFEVSTGFDLLVDSMGKAGDGSGDLYVGGAFSNYDASTAPSIIRLNPDGTVDTGFVTGTGFNNRVYSITPVGDGTSDMYFGGSFSLYNGMSSGRFIRLKSDGSVETSFNVGSGFSGTIWSHALVGDGSGDVYVAGDMAIYKGALINEVVRILADGTLDTTFATGTGFNDRIEAVAPAGDGTGDVYVGGSFTQFDGSPHNRIVRLNADGSLDAAFATGAGFDDRVYVIAMAGDGSGDLYVGGVFAQYDGSGSNSIIRLNSDGSVDTGFAVGAGSWDVKDIALAGDGSGDVYLGGAFILYDGAPSSKVVRVNSDGTLDGGFSVGAGFDDTVRALVSGGPAGDVYVGGQFTLYGSAVVDRVARLCPDGTLD